jgi:HAD superfamily phosphoserine phosphatase-like hydrolase
MSEGVIVFIHGLGGDAQTSWGLFPDLIRKDSELKGYDLQFFSYPTALFSMPWSKKYPKIQTLADALRTEIETRFANHDNIVLVCHSLGGLIARKYLLEEVKNKRALRIQGILLYAVPNNGAGLASVANKISWRHNQLRQLTKDADLIRDLSTDWTTFKVKDALRIKYVVAALDRVVDEESARQFWGNPEIDTVSNRGHRNVVQPIDGNDLVFLILKRFVSSLANVKRVPQPSIQNYATQSRRAISGRPAISRYHIIGFDLDGTLLRGYEYSWRLVWNHLGVQPAIWKEATRRYLTSKRTFEDYKAWCEHDYQQMRAHGLRREHFAQITSSVSPTNNLKDALRTLRTEGFVLALISGGIDTFIDEKIPDAKDLFDYICINRLRFDDQGAISGIDPTPFDFAGKVVALEAICKEYGVTLADSVFVGEGNNDEFVIEAAGLGIAYPPHGQPIPAASRVHIVDDDLRKILDHVLW